MVYSYNLKIWFSTLNDNTELSCLAPFIAGLLGICSFWQARIDYEFYINLLQNKKHQNHKILMEYMYPTLILLKFHIWVMMYQVFYVKFNVAYRIFAVSWLQMQIMMHPLGFLTFVGNRRIPLDMPQIRTWMGSLWQLPLICQILIHLMEGKHHFCR